MSEGPKYVGSKILLAGGREWQAGRSEELRDGWFELRMVAGPQRLRLVFYAWRSEIDGYELRMDCCM
jgi:hypothetical protein